MARVIQFPLMHRATHTRRAIHVAHRGPASAGPFLLVSSISTAARRRRAAVAARRASPIR